MSSNIKSITANSLRFVANHVNETKLNKAAEEARKIYDSIEDKLIDAAQRGEYSFDYSLSKNYDNDVYSLFYKILKGKGFKIDYTSDKNVNFSTFVITISWGNDYSKE